MSNGNRVAAAASGPRAIVWISGWPGCGKTTAGDYLEEYYGYANIDVDDQFMLPRFKDGKPDPDDPLLAGYMKSWGAFFAGEVPSAEDFGPFLEQTVLARIKRLLADHDDKKDSSDVRIVVTQGMHREGRDWFAERLLDDTGRSIFFVGLAASPEKKMLRYRVKAEKIYAARKDGKSFAEAFEERTGKELTDENFERDWREQNTKRIPLMSKMDIDADEIEACRGCNVGLDEGDEKVLPSLEEAVNAGVPLKKEKNLQEMFAESQKKLERLAQMK